MQNKIKELRMSKKMNQEALAKALGYSQQTISRIENGNSIPDIKTMLAIADYFDVSLDYLLLRSNFKRNTIRDDEFEIFVAENYEVLKSIDQLEQKQKNFLLKVIQLIEDYKKS